MSWLVVCSVDVMKGHDSLLGPPTANCKTLPYLLFSSSKRGTSHILKKKQEYLKYFLWAWLILPIHCDNYCYYTSLSSSFHLLPVGECGRRTSCPCNRSCSSWGNRAGERHHSGLSLVWNYSTWGFHNRARHRGRHDHQKTYSGTGGERQRSVHVRQEVRTGSH